MKTYARIDAGVVMEIILPWVDEEGSEVPIDLRFTPDIVATLIDITGIDPPPAPWWTYDGKAFAPPASSV